jgi:hypothetical protein
MRFFPAGMKLTGEQKITCSSTAKYALNSTVQTGLQHIILSVATNSVRMSFGANSTVPARSTGILLVKDIIYEFHVPDPAKLKFSSFNTTAGIVYLAGFGYAGGNA